MQKQLSESQNMVILSMIGSQLQLKQTTYLFVEKNWIIIAYWTVNGKDSKQFSIPDEINDMHLGIKNTASGRIHLFRSLYLYLLRKLLGFQDLFVLKWSIEEPQNGSQEEIYWKRHYHNKHPAKKLVLTKVHGPFW